MTPERAGYSGVSWMELDGAKERVGLEGAAWSGQCGMELRAAVKVKRSQG
jgi:hypothetical protein